MHWSVQPTSSAWPASWGVPPRGFVGGHAPHWLLGFHVLFSQVGSSLLRAGSHIPGLSCWSLTRLTLFQTWTCLWSRRDPPVGYQGLLISPCSSQHGPVAPTSLPRCAHDCRKAVKCVYNINTWIFFTGFTLCATHPLINTGRSGQQTHRHLGH